MLHEIRRDNSHYHHFPRPINLVPGYKVIAGTPNLPSYTLGHSVFFAAGAAVISYMFPQEATLFMDWVLEAAIPRVYGGIHWRFEQGIDLTRFVMM